MERPSCFNKLLKVLKLLEEFTRNKLPQKTFISTNIRVLQNIERAPSKFAWVDAQRNHPKHLRSSSLRWNYSAPGKPNGVRQLDVFIYNSYSKWYLRCLNPSRHNKGARFRFVAKYHLKFHQAVKLCLAHVSTIFLIQTIRFIWLTELNFWMVW